MESFDSKKMESLNPRTKGLLLRLRTEKDRNKLSKVLSKLLKISTASTLILLSYLASLLLTVVFLFGVFYVIGLGVSLGVRSSGYRNKHDLAFEKSKKESLKYHSNKTTTSASSRTDADLTTTIHNRRHKNKYSMNPFMKKSNNRVQILAQNC